MKKRKRAGCGIGADRAPGRFWRENGECRVYGRGAPRRKSVGLLAADGEWDARNKLTPRPAKDGGKNLPIPNRRLDHGGGNLKAGPM